MLKTLLGLPLWMSARKIEFGFDMHHLFIDFSSALCNERISSSMETCLCLRQDEKHTMSNKNTK